MEGIVCPGNMKGCTGIKEDTAKECKGNAHCEEHQIFITGFQCFFIPINATRIADASVVASINTQSMMILFVVTTQSMVLINSMICQ
jgi:hypothetical protein